MCVHASVCVASRLLQAALARHSRGSILCSGKEGPTSETMAKGKGELILVKSRKKAREGCCVVYTDVR